MSMTEFYTSQSAEDGVVLPLYKPDGSKSDHTIKIRGVDSEVFRIAEALAKRRAVDVGRLTDENDRAAAALNARIELAASLVIDWTFDEKCNHANVVKFFQNAPQIVDMVDRIAGDRSLFFALKGSGSVDGSNQSSTSTKPRRAAKPL
jgi:hypothetical protein